MLEQFHFLQPLWLLALLPILPLVWLSFRHQAHSKSWENVIDPKLLPFLLQGQDSKGGNLIKMLLASGWSMAVIALADPVWEKTVRPVFQTNAARVIVLDLSNSMVIDDLKPSRLARARFKIEDILSRNEEGQTGLVLFAGDAFTASPLTRDTETIRSLLKILTPQLMPAQGSRADLGLLKAHELLKQSGVSNGQVLLIADGDSKHKSTLEAANNLRKDGYTVSVLAVGTEKGGNLKFRDQKNILVKLETNKLSDVARNGGGKFHVITTNNSDLQKVLVSNAGVKDVVQDDIQKQEINNEEWKSTGPYLVLILLPFAALAFRRGWLMNIAVVIVGMIMMSNTQQVWAASNDNQALRLWSTLSKNAEQRAAEALIEQDYETVQEVSKDPLRLGSAAYKLNDYEEALKQFRKNPSADARYNEANTLAKLKKYEEAISKYEEALALQPDMSDAIENKKILEEYLKQKQEQQNKQQNQDSQSAENDSSENTESGDASNGQQQTESNNNQQNEQQSQAEASENNNQFSEANKALDENKNEPSSQEKPQQASSKDNEKLNPQQDQTEQNQQENEQLTEQQNNEAKGTNQEADALSKEEQMAAEQWLRRIPDDPGGLLRRKFRSQYKQRRRQFRTTEQPW